MAKKFLLISLFVFFSVQMIAQQAEEQKKAGVALVSKHGDGRVWLRWAPTSAVAWERANAGGWWVERIMLPTATEPGDSLYTLLTKEPLRPLPLESWEMPSDTSDAAAIAAQVLYGQTLKLSASSPAMMLLDKSRELESRFAFALTAAELDFQVALMMGMGMEDKGVLPHRSYIYRVYAHLSDSLLVADTAGVVVNMRERYELPVVFGVKAQARDTMVMLEWPAGYHKGIYSTYRIEKSIEGAAFQVVNTLPLANLFSEGQNDFIHYFSDTHTGEGQALYYRVRGISPFGDSGPASDSVKVHIPYLFPEPHELKYAEVSQQNLAVFWEYPQEFVSKIKNFEIAASREFKSSPQILGSFEAGERSGVIDIPWSELFVSVVAVGVDGTRRNSLPIMVQLDDSIPPAPAVGLYGAIAKDGSVNVGWAWGKESDLLGYRVYAALNPQAEFSLITPDFVRDSVYSWSIPLNTLSSKLYVKIMGYDHRYNYSGFSQMLSLSIPDTVPPSAPLLKQCELMNGGVFFSWVPSGSADVKAHALIYREAEGEWQDTIALFNDRRPGFLWEKPVAGHWDFQVHAIDSAGNSAHSVQRWRLEIKEAGFAEFVPVLRASRNLQKGCIELKWTSHKQAQRAIIYRSVDGGAFRIYSTAEADVFKDEGVVVGGAYTYMVQLESVEALLSLFSKEVKINY